MPSRWHRALVPGVIVGAWSAMLWHSYVVGLGVLLKTWDRGGAFDITTTAAIGLGALLVTHAIANEQQPALAHARVPSWMDQIGPRALSLTAIIALLLLLARQNLNG
jgi:hypothetical protein